MAADPAVARKRPGGLGRGLSALLGEVEREQPVRGGEGAGTDGLTLPVTALAPHPHQPRRRFDEAALDELAESIRARGLIQPIIVRPQGQGYQIVAGERRWRAAQRAGLAQVPVVIRELDEAATLEIALVENIQRQDLNAIEEAEGYQRLIAEFGHTQEALARLVHKSRSHIANLLRLLELPPAVRGAVADGRLTMGHARALVTAPDPETLADQVVARELSVRETEQLARGVRPPSARSGTRSPRSADAGRDPDGAALERHLGDLLGLAVSIANGPNGGTVTISYATMEQLDLVCQRLSGEPI